MPRVAKSKLAAVERLRRKGETPLYISKALDLALATVRKLVICPECEGPKMSTSKLCGTCNREGADVNYLPSKQEIKRLAEALRLARPPQHSPWQKQIPYDRDPVRITLDNGLSL